MTIDQATTTGSSSSTSSSVRNELSADASQLGGSAKERVQEEADTRKQQLTQTARSASSAIGRAADDLDQDDDAPSWLSSAFRQTASGIERLASSVEGRGTDELARDLTRFARESPGAFLAGSAALGFAAARFIRAGADYKNDHASGTGNGGNRALDRTASSSSGSQASTSGYGSNPDAATSSPPAAGYGSNPIEGGNV